MRLNKINWNHIFCEQKIQKLKINWLRKWLLDFLNFKNLFIRLISFSIVLLISNVCFFVMRHNSLLNMYSVPVFNRGMGFSVGNDWPEWTVYLLKTLIAVFFLIFSFSFNEWYLNICFFVVGVNSVLNVIDKVMIDHYEGINHYNTVVDYIDWPQFNFKNNIADIFIVTFIILLVIGVIFYIVKAYRKINKDDIPERIKNEPTEPNP